MIHRSLFVCAFLLGATAVARAGGYFDIEDTTQRHIARGRVTLRVSTHGFDSNNYIVYVVQGSRTGSATQIAYFPKALPSTVTALLPDAIPAPCYLRVTAAGRSGTYTATATNSFGEITVMAKGQNFGRVLQDAGKVSAITAGNKLVLAPLIGHDGSSIISHDAGSLIHQDGAGILGNSSSGFRR